MKVKFILAALAAAVVASACCDCGKKTELFNGKDLTGWVCVLDSESDVPADEVFGVENGNIRNSVNYPACDMGVCSQAGRIAIFHKNIANMLNQFTAVIGEKNINISDMTNKSRGEVAYTMLDIENAATQDLVESLQKIDGVFRVRVVK